MLTEQGRENLAREQVWGQSHRTHQRLKGMCVGRVRTVVRNELWLVILLTIWASQAIQTRAQTAHNLVTEKPSSCHIIRWYFHETCWKRLCVFDNTVNYFFLMGWLDLAVLMSWHFQYCLNWLWPPEWNETGLLGLTSKKNYGKWPQVYLRALPEKKEAESFEPLRNLVEFKSLI